MRQRQKEFELAVGGSQDSATLMTAFQEKYLSLDIAFSFFDAHVYQKVRKFKRLKTFTVMIGRKDDLIFFCIFSKKGRKYHNRILEFPISMFKFEGSPTFPLHLTNSEADFFVDFPSRTVQAQYTSFVTNVCHHR
jgi:hypothetical protein